MMVPKICLYRPAFNMLELKKTKALIMFLVLNQKVYLNLRLHSSIYLTQNILDTKQECKFNNTPLVVEQNNYTTKIVNAYIELLLWYD